MARRKKKSNTKAISFHQESTIKKLQSQLIDPRVQSWLWGGASGVRERIMTLNFETIRRAVHQLPLVNSIINTRVDQILPFLKYATNKNDRGFRFEIENQTEAYKSSTPDDDEIIQLTTFIEQTGFLYDPEREDDLTDYVTMLVRDIYEIDQIATEIQYNRFGEPVAFWALDGAQIARVVDPSMYGKGIRYIQKIDEKVYEQYGADDLLFDYKFKRSDVRYRGYGYSPVEQCINIITTLLFGYNYIRDQLIRDRVPKGFISVMGDVGKQEMDAIRNYWYAAMTGAGASFSVPILPSGKDGVGIDFKSLNQSNKDMEYHKTMMFVSSLVGAVFGIDLAELGIKTDDSTSLIGENTEPRIQTSRDRGLASMLSFIEQHLNKVIRKVTKKYRFRFVGLEREDEQKREEIRAKQLQVWRSVDEIRKEEGEDPYDEDWSKMPMNPQIVQVFLAEKQAKQQAEMSQQGGGFPEDGQQLGNFGQDQQQNNGEDAGMEKSLSDFQRLTNLKEQEFKILID